MSFHLVHHLPRLVASVAKIFMCEKNEHFDLLFCSYFMSVFILIYNQDKLPVLIRRGLCDVMQMT